MSPEMVCPTLVARQVEWASLEAALDGVGNRVGALCALLGEAGIGKSRLVAEVSTAAEARGVPVLLGRAVDAGTPVPNRPLFEALAAWSRRAGPNAHPELAPFRETLSPVVPEWRPAAEPAFRASPMELGEALLRLLAGIAGDRGCVLVLEDLHWADPDTAAVLEYVGDNIADTGVLCVVTARTDTATDALGVVRALTSRRAATVLELRRLDPAELTEMVHRCLGTDLPSDDVDGLVQRFSDGLPFLVEELLASAVAGGSLVGGPDGWHLEVGAGPVVPQRFEDLVRRRMAQLSEEDAATLSLAAALGPRFDAELLPIITERSPDLVLDTLRKGTAAQLLVADPADPRTFAFRHALTRDALLSRLLPIERVALARQVLAAIEEHHPDLPGDLCELAAALAEQVGDGERAAELLLEAARRACARGALSSAEPTLDRAWRLARPDGAVWLAVGDLLMTVLTDTGDIDRPSRWEAVCWPSSRRRALGPGSTSPWLGRRRPPAEPRWPTERSSGRGRPRIPRRSGSWTPRPTSSPPTSPPTSGAATTPKRWPPPPWGWPRPWRTMHWRAMPFSCSARPRGSAGTGWEPARRSIASSSWGGTMACPPGGCGA